MLRVAYSLLFYLMIPAILVRLIYRSLKAPAYRDRWGERFGYAPNEPGQRISAPTIWIHAVSVGETQASQPLVEALLANRPSHAIVITTMTPTGSERVKALFGDRVHHAYLPYDLPGAMAKFIRSIDPSLLIIMETELWPNMLHYTRRAGCHCILVNARLSEKSARGYARFAALTRQMLRNLDVIATQGEKDAERFIKLGADGDRVRSVGSLKFHQNQPAAQETDKPEFFHSLQDLERPVLIAASTREGEEEHVLRAFGRCVQETPQLLLVLVPRHPERFDAVAKLCQQNEFTIARRSLEQSVQAESQVLLGDSMGEMPHYFALADIAFVGGSLVDTGCHNVLEPAALGLPVLVGPSQFNFQTICELLEEEGRLAHRFRCRRSRSSSVETDEGPRIAREHGERRYRNRSWQSGRARKNHEPHRFPSRFELVCSRRRFAREISASLVGDQEHYPQCASRRMASVLRSVSS